MILPKKEEKKTMVWKKFMLQNKTNKKTKTKKQNLHIYYCKDYKSMQGTTGERGLHEKRNMSKKMLKCQ